MKTAFCPKNHLCWFSRNPEYKTMTIEEVFQKDPAYILWCYENLKGLRFATGLKDRIKRYKKSLQ